MLNWLKSLFQSAPATVAVKAHPVSINPARPVAAERNAQRVKLLLVAIASGDERQSLRDEFERRTGIKITSADQAARLQG